MPIPSSPIIANAFINNISNPLSSGDFDFTFDWVINKWANIADDLLKTVIPISTTVVAARNSFIATLGSLSSSSTGVTLLENAFMQYATVLATGMTGAGFTGIPPTMLPDITSITTANQDSDTFAHLLENILIPWAKTGTAYTLPSGPTINWN